MLAPEEELADAAEPVDDAVDEPELSLEPVAEAEEEPMVAEPRALDCEARADARPEETEAVAEVETEEEALLP